MTTQPMLLGQNSPLGLPSPSSAAQFSPANYRAVIDQLKQRLVDIGNDIESFVAALRSRAASWVGQVYAAGAARINEIAAQIVQIKNQVVAKINDLLVGVEAPFAMFDDAQQWQRIRLLALQVSAATEPGTIDPELRSTGAAFTSAWTGRAAQKYYDAIPAQSAAAFRVSSLAGEASSALLTSASAGLALYTSLLYLLITAVKIIAGAIAAIASLLNPLTAITVGLEQADKVAGLMSNLLTDVISVASNYTQLFELQAATVAGLEAVVKANNNFPPNVGYGPSTGKQPDIDLMVGKWPDPTADAKWPVDDSGQIRVQ